MNWFCSYLSSRQQCVEVDGTRSDFRAVTCGVPQGSILGPQLFLIYVNDMSSCLDCRLSLYADDSALFFAHKEYSVVARRLSEELAKCKKWLIDNRLSLHMGKTECLLFGTSKSLKRARDFSVTCDGIPIKRVNSFKYLGVVLNETMSGECHGKELVRKCAGRISFLYRYSSLLDQHTRSLLCTSLLQPYLDYCCSSWYHSLSSRTRQRLDVIQRRMIRFVFSFGPRHHVDFSHFKRLSWLCISDRVKYFKLIHVFKVRHGLAPSYLSDRFKRVDDMHSYNTRGSRRNFSVSNEICDSLKSFSYTAVKDWNSLPSFLKELDSLTVFKSRLRQYFLDSY